VTVAAGAGAAAGFADDDYRDAGASVSDDPTCDLLLAVGPATAAECAGAARVLGFLDPLGSPETIEGFAAAGIDAYAMEFVPRTTLAQSMDALSSQATVAGYQAVLVAAVASPRFFPMLMTAAGTVRPSRVLVLGAGVAGLMAISTARRLGAVVSGYDIRPAAREQVESLGASFVGGPLLDESETAGGYASEVDEATKAEQQAALASAVAESDVIITTAQVPGKTAPVLITADMVASMKRGAVIVDMAAASGGNCELSQPDAVVEHADVTILGPTDLAAGTPADASQMYSRNVVALVQYLFGPENRNDDPDDEIATSACVVRDGSITDERVRDLIGGTT